MREATTGHLRTCEPRLAGASSIFFQATLTRFRAPLREPLSFTSSSPCEPNQAVNRIAGRIRQGSVEACSGAGFDLSWRSPLAGPYLTLVRFNTGSDKPYTAASPLIDWRRMPKSVMVHSAIGLEFCDRLRLAFRQPRAQTPKTSQQPVMILPIAQPCIERRSIAEPLAR